LDNQASTVKL